MSRATRAAICSRVKRFIAASLLVWCVSRCRPRRCLQLRRRRDLDDAMHEDARRDDMLGIEIAEVDDLAHLGDRAARGGGHDGPEIARRLAIDQVTPAIAAQRLDEREVGADRVLEDIIATVDASRLLAFRERRAMAGRRVKGADAGARGADALGEVALRHEFEFDLPVLVEAVEYP